MPRIEITWFSGNEFRIVRMVRTGDRWTLQSTPSDPDVLEELRKLLGVQQC